MLRGQPALVEWSTKNASFHKHSRVGYQGLIRPFRFLVSMIDGFEASGIGSRPSVTIDDSISRVHSISGRFLARHHSCSDQPLNYWCEGVVTVCIVDDKSPMSSLDPWIIVVIG